MWQLGPLLSRGMGGCFIGMNNFFCFGLKFPYKSYNTQIKPIVSSTSRKVEIYSKGPPRNKKQTLGRI